MRTIEPGCFGIIVGLAECGTAGTISSNLHDPINDPDAGNADLCEQYGAAISAIESLILAHACAGIDITTPAYIEGIETTVEAITNRY